MAILAFAFPVQRVEAKAADCIELIEPIDRDEYRHPIDVGLRDS